MGEANRTKVAAKVPKTPEPWAITPDQILLAKNIAEMHSQITDAEKKGSERVLACGQMLLDAKTAVGHGNLEAFVTVNCGMEIRTAQRYMAYARAVRDGKATICRFYTNWPEPEVSEEDKATAKEATKKAKADKASVEVEKIKAEAKAKADKEVEVTLRTGFVTAWRMVKPDAKLFFVQTNKDEILHLLKQLEAKAA
jgi:hypothetical protein